MTTPLKSVLAFLIETFVSVANFAGVIVPGAVSFALEFPEFVIQ